VKDLGLHAETVRRCSHIPQVVSVLAGLVGFDKNPDEFGRGDQLVKQLQSLGPDLNIQRGHAGEIATRSIEAGHKTELHRVGRNQKGNRNGGRSWP
jgi:hypothetical protein